MINFDLDIIGSKNTGASSSSISKWEKSFFGGFYRLVVDYPAIKIDDNIEFNLSASTLSYFDKEKIMKIFISQSKNHGLISSLLHHSKTSKYVNLFGQTVIKTIIDRNDKKDVLNNLIDGSHEYGPLFNHYKKFILDSEIYFQQTQNDENGDGGKDKNEQQDQEQQEQKSKNGSKNTKKKNDDKKLSSSSNTGNKKNEKEKENKEADPDKQQSKSQKPTQREIDYMESKFKNALEKTTERKIKFKSISGFDGSVNIQVQESSNKTRFSRKEKDIADRLTKMLDISFDPASDTVKNLRLGKLDVAKIAEVPAGNIAIYKQTVENQTTKPFSVAILCDESGSMGETFYNYDDGDDANNYTTEVTRIEAQHSIVKSLYKCFSDILPQEKIFIYGHSDNDDDDPALFVYQDKYNNNFVNTIDNMLSRDNGNNYDGPVIEEVYRQIRNFTNDRIIFIVLSDGQPAGNNYGGPKDIKKMKQIIEKCKRDEFVTVGIGIETFHVQDLYQYSAIVKNLEDMPKKVSHIVNHVVKTEFQ